MVGVKGFEPPAPCSQSTYATKLRYTPLDPVAVTAVGFAPDDEIYLTIPASICQHLFSIFPKKLLPLSSSLRSAPWLPCVRGAVRRRAGLKGCPMGRGQGGGRKPSPIPPGLGARGRGPQAPSPVCTRFAAAQINYTHQDRVSPPQGVSGAAAAAPD